MRTMSRKLAFIVVALLLTAAPLLHQHPVDGISSGSNTAGPCVVCATSITRLPQLAPSVEAPRVVVYALDAVIELTPADSISSNTPSRAPPAR